MQLNSRDKLKQLCFTTYVVTIMKTPHLLSSECDLTICTRSAQASHKDFVAATQIVVSQYSAELPLHADRLIRAAAQTILADLMPASHTIHNRFSRCPHFETLLIGRRHAAFSSVTFCRLQSSEMGFPDSLPDNTIRIAMTIPTQIQNQPLVSPEAEISIRSSRSSIMTGCG